MTKPSTKSNISYNIIYQVLVMILPFVTAPYLSRIIGSEGVGIYSYTHSIANYFTLFSLMGLANYGNRCIAQSRDNRQLLKTNFSEIYTMQILFSSLSLFVYVVGVLLFGGEYRTILCIQMLYVFSAGLDISWFYYGMEQFKLMVLRNAIVKIITTICIFVFVKSVDDLWKYAFIMATGSLVSQITLWVRIKNIVMFKIASWRNVRKHIKSNLILFIPVIAVSLYRVMDKIMLGAISTMEQTGIYENSDKLVTLPLTIITSIGTVMMPKMSNIFARGNSNQSYRLIRDSMQLIVALSSGMMFGMAAIAQVFAPIYYGNEFIECGTMIMAMSPILLFDSIANVIRTQYLIPKSKDKIYIISVILGAVLNMLINLLCIPKLGAMGAVIGTIVAEFTVMLVQCMCVRKDLEFSTYTKDSWFYIISGSVMFVLIKLIQKNAVASLSNVFTQIIIGVFVYGSISALLMFIFSRDRFLHFKNMFVR